MKQRHHPGSKQRSRQVMAGAHVEKELAEKALDDGDHQQAWTFFKQALSRLTGCELNPDGRSLLISTTIDFQNLSIFLGKGLSDFAPYLIRAKSAAENIGDLRSRALILLHLGRFHHFHKHKHEALAYFEKGKAAVEQLGDEDIFSQSAELLGFYYQIKGRYLDALPHYERAAKNYEAAERGAILNPLGPISLGLCYAFIGRFHYALGTLDYYRRLALERFDSTLATTMQAITGIVFLLMAKKDEAFQHLTEASREAKKTNNDIAYYLASGYLSYYELMEGRVQESWNALNQFIRQGKKSGLSRQYESPITLEHLYELHRLGLTPIPGFGFEETMKRHLKEPNIQFRGVAHRLLAMTMAAEPGNFDRMAEELKKSETYLQQSGDAIQLAKTWLEMARLQLKKNSKLKARYFARRAWQAFSIYGDVFFPDNLRYLLLDQNPDKAGREKSREIMERFISMIQELAPSMDLDELMSKTVKATNRFFGAERGGLFWFKTTASGNTPKLRGAYCLTQQEVSSDVFKRSLEVIRAAYEKKSVQLTRIADSDSHPEKTRAVFCLPFDIAGQTRGVLYHDNAYVPDCFDFLEKAMLIPLGDALSKYIEQIYVFSRHLEQSAREKLPSARISSNHAIVAESPIMLDVLAKGDRVAMADSTVLILGETGVGKELLAHRIHLHSRRSKGPFIILDATTIPENLFESELFGHEKGAFTGADQPKAGRLELAHKGTLFIDEIGEIPKSLQTKLLRVLQEKTLVRLGGKRTISTDFRLIVATNRDLAAEVSAGRFREDLYFRLNVVPMELPPLRKRGGDILLLAEAFLDRYSAKYSRPLPALSGDDCARMMAYAWPGNIRELQNIIERAVILCTEDDLTIDLPVDNTVSPRQLYQDHPTMDEFQRRYIKYTIEKSGGKIGGPGGAAEMLGMKRTTLQKRMIRLGMT